MSSDFLDAFARLPRAQQRGVRTLIFRFNDTRSSPPVAEREELTETGLGSTARCRGRRRHRQANSVRVCSPTSRRVASLRPRSAGLTALTPAPRTLVQIGSCRRCSLIHPLHVVVDVPSRMTLFRATADMYRRVFIPRPGDGLPSVLSTRRSSSRPIRRRDEQADGGGEHAEDEPVDEFGSESVPGLG